MDSGFSLSHAYLLYNYNGPPFFKMHAYGGIEASNLHNSGGFVLASLKIP